MKKHLSILFCIAFIFSIYAQEARELRGIDKELNELLVISKAAGFSVAVVKGDKIIYAKGFGYRDYENKISADANTLYAIGSSTKSFTSAILGQLEDEGKISLDDNPRKHLPELKFFNADMNNNIIIKDLMSHRTGLPRHDFSWYLFPTKDKDSLLQRIANHEPFTGIRQQWYYNNFMFLAQGVLAERVTGSSWEDNIKERFFAPLKMTRSNLSIDALKKSSNAAYGYEVKDSKISKMDYYHISAMGPAGSINSSVNEMSNWLITWINKGKFKEEEILSESYVRAAMSSQMVVTSALPSEEFPDMHLKNYGYGWMVSSYRGHYQVEHGGNIDGFSASVAFYPSDKIGIVVLANQNGSSVPNLVRNIISDRLLKLEKINWTKKFKDQKKEANKLTKEAKKNVVSNRIEDTQPSHVLDDYTGTYKNLGYGSFKISKEQDSLFAQFKLKNLYLKHYHYDVFQVFEVKNKKVDTVETIPLKFNFITSEVGEIGSIKIKIEQLLDPLEFKRVLDEIEVDKSTLEVYVGEYVISGMTLKVYLKGEKTLYLFVPGQPEYELLPIEKNIFKIKSLEGYKIEFVEGKKNAINGVLMIQPNGTFKAERK
ncbi:MAG: serine hydrolase [Cellulophaga sp.]